MLEPRQGSADDARTVEILNRYGGTTVQRNRAMMPDYVPDKDIRSIRISKKAYKGLQEIALSLGYTHRGQGNVSVLMEAIGQGTVSIVADTNVLGRPFEDTLAKQQD